MGGCYEKSFEAWQASSGLGSTIQMSFLHLCSVKNS